MEISSCKLFLTVIIAGAFVGIFAKDYCNVQSCKRKNKIQTMCQYPNPNPAPQCGTWRDEGLNDAERKVIVDLHNKLRQKVASGKETRGHPGPQPAAVEMPNLVWDKELETIAQRWANQCNYGHSCADTDQYQVGQNVAEHWGSLEDIVNYWYSEVDEFPKNYAHSLPRGYSDGLHYTQIVYGTTTKIGCGRIRYRSASSDEQHYLVCNYAPPGNYPNRPIYKIKG